MKRLPRSGMKKQTIAYHEASHAVVAQRLGYRVDGASIVPKEGREGHVNLPNPMHRKDPGLDRHRRHVEHAASWRWPVR
jgi:ATP-dependent Zn protease